MRKFSILLAALILAVMIPAACAKRDGGTTSDPLAMNTTGSISTRMPATYEPSPSATSEISLSPSAGLDTDMPQTSASPDRDAAASSAPGNTARLESDIEDFMEGRVIDPVDVPNIVNMLEREFPGHDIQSITHEYIDGYKAYRVVLQGSGELARTVYVLSSGTLILPGNGD